jgi:hypothetical protein
MRNTCASRSLPACFRRSKKPQKASTRFQEDPLFLRCTNLPQKSAIFPSAVPTAMGLPVVHAEMSHRPDRPALGQGHGVQAVMN